MKLVMAPFLIFKFHVQNYIQMQICNYRTDEPLKQTQALMQKIFSMRKFKKFSIKRQGFPQTFPEELKKRDSFTKNSEPEHIFDETEQDLVVNKGPNVALKTKLIKKVLGTQIDVKREKELQKQYSHYLINLMHKTNLLAIKERVPPELSVLDTVDDGDYPEEVAKIYPHFSNLIKLHELPSIKSVVYQKQLVRQQQPVFNIEDNCVVKVKQVTRFVSILYKNSIKFQKSWKLLKYTKQGGQNCDFEKIGAEINLSFQTCKLLFDFLDDFYEIEKDLTTRRSEESKIRAAKGIISRLKAIMRKETNDSAYRPHAEIYLSLRDLRRLINSHREDDSDQEV